MAAAFGRVSPRASTVHAIDEAVPIVMQCPALRLIHDSASRTSFPVTSPLTKASESCQVKVPEPTFLPFQYPLSIGPPGTTIVGKSTLQAPIIVEGVVLSQPVSKTTPSIGLARILSSVSILAKFLHNIVVGFINVSPSDMTGNSRGNPPAS